MAVKGLRPRPLRARHEMRMRQDLTTETLLGPNWYLGNSMTTSLIHGRVLKSMSIGQEEI